jgi:hypothetical protein
VYRRVRVAISEDSNQGLMIRLLVLGLVMTALLGISWLICDWIGCSISFRELLVVFLSVFLPMATSIVVGEMPRGNDWIMVRLALATFCRTGLPLFLVVVITLLSKKQLQPIFLGFLVLFYIFGILSVVLLSVKRLAQAPVESDKKR